MDPLPRKGKTLFDALPPACDAPTGVAPLLRSHLPFYFPLWTQGESG